MEIGSRLTDVRGDGRGLYEDSEEILGMAAPCGTGSRGNGNPGEGVTSTGNSPRQRQQP